MTIPIEFLVVVVVGVEAEADVIATCAQDLTVDMNLASGFINNVTLRRTIPLKQGDRFFDGLNALYVLDNGPQSSIVADAPTALKTMVMTVVVAMMTTMMMLI